MSPPAPAWVRQPIDPAPARPGCDAAVALSFLVIVTLANLRGIADSARINVVLTLVELGGRLLVTVVGTAAIPAGGGASLGLTATKSPGTFLRTGALLLLGVLLAGLSTWRRRTTER
jgi:amino acid transporter